jgi:hypothetical protein
MKITNNPAPTSPCFDRWLLNRQAGYNVCCQRTGAHRFDCSDGKREQAVRSR